QLLSYSSKRIPHCTGGFPSVKFPGYLKPHKGQVEISRPIKTEQGPLIAQLTLKQDSFLLGEICNRGRSLKYVSADTCSFDFCEAVGEQHCNLFQRPRIITLNDISDALKKSFSLPTAPTKLISGQWKVSVRLTQNDRMLGEFRVGKGGQWINVEASTYRDEL
uniref:Uncharacterized protein n=1 Tax=Parascaris univalens TaxID=6257 RepID=A0A915AC53_PARUN